MAKVRTTSKMTISGVDVRHVWRIVVEVLTIVVIEIRLNVLIIVFTDTMHLSVVNHGENIRKNLK